MVDSLFSGMSRELPALSRFPTGGEGKGILVSKSLEGRTGGEAFTPRPLPANAIVYAMTYQADAISPSRSQALPGNALTRGSASPEAGMEARGRLPRRVPTAGRACPIGPFPGRAWERANE